MSDCDIILNVVPPRIVQLYMTNKRDKTNSKPPADRSESQVSGVFSLEQLEEMGVPIGTFGGSHDFMVRIRDGALVAANTGTQGGGQN